MIRKLLLIFALIGVLSAEGQEKDKFSYKPVRILSRQTDNNEIPELLRAPAQSAQSVSSAAGNGISETVGELSVSLTGGAGYNIPVAVPQGINGIEPSISLSYNSQGGNGLAGFGWNVSGVSVITRIPSTKFHDNNIDGVDFDLQDRYSFDGQRLILKSGVYGGDGAQYETENFSNVKITSHGVSPYGSAYGPTYFIVTYPDGSEARYGYSNDSRSRTDYAISYWVNPQGIRINYTYTTSDNSLSISNIAYGTAGSSPLNEIQFIYKTRKRPEQSFTGGQDFKRKNLLSEIRVKGNGIGYRNYVLTHNYNTLGYDRLVSVQEKSGDNTLSYSPITFSYDDTPTNIASTGIVADLGVINIEQRNANVVPFDLTGNGKMDFIVYPTTGTDLRKKFWVFKDLQSVTTNFAFEIGLNGNTFEQIFPVTWLSHNSKVLPGQGFVVVKNTNVADITFEVYSDGFSTPITHQYDRFWEAPKITTGFTCQYDFQIGGCSLSYQDLKIPKEYLSGDFNGDGLSDIIAVEKDFSYANVNCGPPDPFGFACDEVYNNINASPKKVHFINLDRRITGNFVNLAGILQAGVAEDDKLMTADVNGDGKTDILHFKTGKVYAYTLTQTNTLQLLWQTTDTRIKLDKPILLGDYNGDGKTDFMIPAAADSSLFALFRSTGSSFFKTELTYPFQYKLASGASPLYLYNLIPTDINGDGRTDILDYRTVTYNSSSNGTQTVTAYNNIFSTALDVAPAFAIGNSVTRTGNLKHFPIPIFLTSEKPNNNLDFASISNQWITTFKFNKDNREDMLLRSVSSNSITQSITYRDLDETEIGPDFMPVYQRSYDQTYPYIDIGNARGTKVVTGLTRTGGGAGAVKQLFSYMGAVSHAEGLGFLGFRGVARSNWHIDGGDRKFSMSLHDPQLRGAVVQDYFVNYSINFSGNPASYIVKNSYTYTSSLGANKVFNIKNTGKESDDGLTGLHTSQSFVYDIYNNPTQVTTTFAGHGSTVTNITYANSTGFPYYIGRPVGKTQTTTIGADIFSTEEQLVYNGYLVSERKTKGNGTQFNSETFIYDAYGNVTKKTTTPYGEASREVNFEYDSSGRFLTKSIDVEGLATTYLYNTATGMLTREANPFGQQTNYTYDAWDRPVTATDYLGKSVTTSYVEDVGSYYTVTTTGDDGSSRSALYDPLKRLVRTTEKDALGQFVSKSYEYDALGKQTRESEPFFGSAATQWNTTEYDLYDRVSRVTAFNGKVTNLSYTGFSATVNDGTKSVTTTKNAFDKVVMLQDPGGTVNYTYYGNGNLKTADYGGVAVSVEQDGWGRKTKLTDPSAGIYTYEYNGFGETTKETTPKGQTVYAYDSKGKLLSKVLTGDDTDMAMLYTYHATTKLPTQLNLTNADGNNAVYTYAYDVYNRPVNVVETGAFAKFTKWFTYDAFGRLDTEESEARLLTNNKYSKRKIQNTYQNGSLKTITDVAANQTIWSVTGLNARGQVTASARAAALTQTNTYDAYGYVTRMLTQKTGTATTDLLDLGFTFDTQRGLLTARRNGPTGGTGTWNETFTYDTQDRLLGFNDNNGNRSHTYDARGRITNNSSVGDYAYGGTSYQQAELTLNTAGQDYYNNFAKQTITYNAFKSPVEIVEEGKDHISFMYNASQGRAAMFWGGTQADKLQRRYRRFYAADGTMEITFDALSNKTTFVTYMGGDAYGAPAVWHSEQTSTTAEGYFYLFRDYLGSILAITDSAGMIKEKRHFDAWGEIAILQDGAGNALSSFTLIDRGYTGHEHLLGVGLVHMNGRLYDPKLHRFLMPDNFVQDPYNTQNFNRYGYVLNNPLMYVDFSGEYTETGGDSSEFNGAGWANVIANILGNFDSIKGWVNGWWPGARNWIGSQAKSVGDAIARPFRETGRFFKRLFGGGRDRAPSPEVQMFEIPGNMSASVPTNLSIFGPTGGGGMGISAGDVADTVLDFVPIAGGVKDIYNGINEGDGWQVALGAGFIVLDVFTLGGSSLVKGGIKTGIKVGARSLAREGVELAAKGGTKLLNAAPASLTQKGLNHILARHAFSSTAKGAGKFAQGTSARQLKSLINTATTKGTFRPNTFGRPGTIAEFNFRRTIGTNIGGNAASNLRVVIGPNGSVITAFPF
ncbi:MAG: RHS repeat-associated core domain-containing protein [Flavobacteriaceae bacterium]|nr:RHS repeat-associated core domain-containing protein [Flavobacteriaceae bacterium]